MIRKKIKRSNKEKTFSLRYSVMTKSSGSTQTQRRQEFVNVLLDYARLYKPGVSGARRERDAKAMVHRKRALQILRNSSKAFKDTVCGLRNGLAEVLDMPHEKAVPELHKWWSDKRNWPKEDLVTLAANLEIDATHLKDVVKKDDEMFADLADELCEATGACAVPRDLTTVSLSEYEALQSIVADLRTQVTDLSKLIAENADLKGKLAQISQEGILILDMLSDSQAEVADLNRKLLECQTSLADCRHPDRIKGLFEDMLKNHPLLKRLWEQASDLKRTKHLDEFDLGAVKNLIISVGTLPNVPQPLQDLQAQTPVHRQPPEPCANCKMMKEIVDTVLRCCMCEESPSFVQTQMRPSGDLSPVKVVAGGYSGSEPQPSMTDRQPSMTDRQPSMTDRPQQSKPSIAEAKEQPTQQDTKREPRDVYSIMNKMDRLESESLGRGGFDFPSPTQSTVGTPAKTAIDRPSQRPAPTSQVPMSQTPGAPVKNIHPYGPPQGQATYAPRTIVSPRSQPSVTVNINVSCTNRNVSRKERSTWDPNTTTLGQIKQKVMNMKNELIAAGTRVASEVLKMQILNGAPIYQNGGYVYPFDDGTTLGKVANGKVIGIQVTLDLTCPEPVPSQESVRKQQMLTNTLPPPQKKFPVNFHLKLQCNGNSAYKQVIEYVDGSTNLQDIVRLANEMTEDFQQDKRTLIVGRVMTSDISIKTANVGSKDYYEEMGLQARRNTTLTQLAGATGTVELNVTVTLQCEAAPAEASRVATFSEPEPVETRYNVTYEVYCQHAPNGSTQSVDIAPQEMKGDATLGKILNTADVNVQQFIRRNGFASDTRKTRIVNAVIGGSNQREIYNDRFVTNHNKRTTLKELANGQTLTLSVIDGVDCRRDDEPSRSSPQRFSAQPSDSSTTPQSSPQPQPRLPDEPSRSEPQSQSDNEDANVAAAYDPKGKTKEDPPQGPNNPNAGRRENESGDSSDVWSAGGGGSSGIGGISGKSSVGGSTAYPTGTPHSSPQRYVSQQKQIDVSVLCSSLTRDPVELSQTYFRCDYDDDMTVAALLHHALAMAKSKHSNLGEDSAVIKADLINEDKRYGRNSQIKLSTIGDLSKGSVQLQFACQK